MGLFDFLRPKIDTSNFVTIDQYNELKGQLRQIIEFIPVEVDMKLYVLKSELPDTVKYIENSNSTSKIKKISISIEDKATFKAADNPPDNIAHTI